MSTILEFSSSDPFGGLRRGVSLAKIEGGHDGTFEKEFPRSQEVPIAVVGCEFATMAPLGCRDLTLLTFEVRQPRSADIRLRSRSDGANPPNARGRSLGRLL